MRPRAASARLASRDSTTRFAPWSPKIFAIASPIPMEAPVITTTFPERSMSSFYAGRQCKSRTGVQSAHIRCLGGVLESKLLPILPLDSVLLPGIPLPLHVFEPRYKEMIGECLSNKTPFGVVRAKDEEGIAEIGCTAEILTVTKEYDDGRMDIVTQGRERFEIVAVHHERAFLQAEVLFLLDEPDRASHEEAQEA